MRYVALLRGINVGGNNKVEMPKLKAAFERVGCKDVTTYINTGNIVFSSEKSAGELASILEKAIDDSFGLSIRVLLRSKDQYMAMMADVPDTWTNDKEMKSDVLFLWDEVDDPGALGLVPARDGIDRALYSNGALLWSVDRANQAKSGLIKLVGTKVYKQMTVRNVNTARKIAEIL